MEKIILVKPSIEYENQVMNYKKIFEDNDQSFDGCAGLEEVNSYKEWLNFDKRLQNKYGDEYVPSTVYLAIRESDKKANRKR